MEDNGTAGSVARGRVNQSGCGECRDHDEDGHYDSDMCDVGHHQESDFYLPSQESELQSKSSDGRAYQSGRSFVQLRNRFWVVGPGDLDPPWVSRALRVDLVLIHHLDWTYLQSEWFLSCLTLTLFSSVALFLWALFSCTETQAGWQLSET